MHFEILSEDQSGEIALNILIQKIISVKNTYTIHSYKGIGRLPKGLKPGSDPQKRILLDQLPKLIRGYGKTFQGYHDYSAVVIIVLDLDDKDLNSFETELNEVVNTCNPKPETYFCFAIEEGEAWFLGDMNAIKMAYPNAKDSVLNTYENDSICGTWEKLADAIFPGGSISLKKQGWMKIGKTKSEWAERITPSLDIENNQSPSFHYFKNKLLELAHI
ncbi:MAG: DUF4276 family protein [Desulfobacterales bacterium]|nr:DUF4276 family protein [Desulfobacterales bacterium]